MGGGNRFFSDNDIHDEPVYKMVDRYIVRLEVAPKLVMYMGKDGSLVLKSYRLTKWVRIFLTEKGAEKAAYEAGFSQIGDPYFYVEKIEISTRDL